MVLVSQSRRNLSKVLQLVLAELEIGHLPGRSDFLHMVRLEFEWLLVGAI